MVPTENERIDALEQASTIILGRLNGLASLVIVMSRHLAPDVARKCADDAQQALIRIDANLLASTHPDAMAAEMQRIIREGISIFDKSAQDTSIN